MAICRTKSRNLVSDVNGRHGEVDWTPIRYLNKGFGQTVLAGLYRTAQVGVVTPLHDGMNLVAKEYVAAQNPADPGVLVLSKFAGAANELDTALLVNPHDIDGMARAIATALSMPLTERRDALGGDDGEAARPHHPAMVRRFRRRAAGSADREVAAAPLAAQPPQAAALAEAGDLRRAVDLARHATRAAVAPQLLATRRSNVTSLNSNTTRHRARRTARLFGAFGLSIGTTPLPWPTNTPGPTMTELLLPMMTLGCGESRLERVPSGQMMASPDSMPRRPSSQVTSTPWRVQACASAGAAKGGAKWPKSGSSAPMRLA